MSRFDVVVLGQEGTAAAALLAQAGAHVLQVREPEPPRHFGALFALDARLIGELKLARHGLSFLHRDLPHIGLCRDMEPLTLERRPLQGGPAARAGGDTKIWPLFRHTMLRRARTLRRWWEHPMLAGEPEDVLDGERAMFARLQWTDAESYLAARFESEKLKAMLLFDAVAGGFAPSEPGSALALVWRASQEMAGLQGASALAAPGTLDMTLAAAAADAEVATADARPMRILMDNGRAAGVVLADGEEIGARLIVSALSRAHTLALMGAPLPVDPAPVGEAQLLLTLEAPHGLAPARYVVAGPHQADAYEAARDGRLAADLPLEFVPVGPDRLAVTVRPVPLANRQGLRAVIAAHASKAIARHVPGLKVAVIAFAPPATRTRATLGRLVAPAWVRAATPADNVLLCGPDAEPVACVSGRAARFAAGFAHRLLAR